MNRIVEMKDGGRQYGRQGRRGTISNQFLSRPTTLPVRAQKKKKREKDSHLEYLGTKCKYSRRMIMVRFILVETTLPVRMRPRIETRPVNGHFLSM